MLNHIALTINDLAEIKSFYEEVLLFRVKYIFQIKKAASLKIFDIGNEAEVYLMNHQGTDFEIFVNQNEEKRVFSHICLSYWKCEYIYLKAMDEGYKVTVRINNDKKTYFIRDHSGNLFEIKEMEERK